ncbi:MAG: hypothetical protein NTV22_01705 [bacterium]|nr:hypothetical protein [bacterium]
MPATSTTGPRKLHWYVDESGNFNEPGIHVLAIVGCLATDTSLSRDVDDVFRSFGHDTTSFHATSLVIEERLRILDALTTHLGARIRILVASLDLINTPDYDPYFPVLAKALELTTKQWRSNPLDDCWPVPIDIHLEHRSRFNNQFFGQHLAERARLPAEGNVQFTMMNLRKGTHPLMQVADLASNVARSSVIGNTLLPQGIIRLTIPSNYVTGNDARAVHKLLTEGVREVTRVVVNTEHVTHIVRDDRSLSNALANELADKLAKQQLADEHSKSACFTAMNERLSQLSVADWHHEVEKLIQQADTAAKAREHLLSIVLSELALHSLEHASSTFSQSTMVVRLLRLQAVSRWLAAHNHLGLFVANADVILSAEREVKDLQADPGNWPAIADLYNFISVAHQNQFDFSTAIERVRPLVEYFEQLRHTPFGSTTPAGNSVAALYASYAQSLFFNAHRTYFAAKGAGFQQYTDDALVYSEYSESLFDNDTDRRRQPVYRAHGLMQQFMLTGDQHVLAQAGTLLGGLGDTATLMTAFFEKPADVDGNALYCFEAVLKHAWLSKEPLSIPCDKKIIDKVLARLPACHPYEQILGYFALLDLSAPAATRLLSELAWSSSLVKTIAVIFRMQIAWQHSQQISDDMRKELNKSMDADLRTKWQEYGLWNALDCIADRRYVGLGPLTLLPFNYS